MRLIDKKIALSYKKRLFLKRIVISISNSTIKEGSS